MKQRKKGQQKKRKLRQRKLFLFLLALVFILGSLNIAKGAGWLIPAQKELKTENGAIDLDSMTLEQKIAQMVVVQGDVQTMFAWKNMLAGGIHLFGRKSENVFRNTIIDFQLDMPVPFFVTLDLEGCINPFSYFKQFAPAAEITSVGQAFEKGFSEGAYLKELGFNINFAPVVDLQDEIWNCRVFPGDEKNIAELARAYMLGLQTHGITATVKHYPGKTLAVQDPHKFVVAAEITERDLFPYDYILEKGEAKAVMVSHLITTGSIDSGGMPAVVSEEIIRNIKQEFAGLIISDEINMLGLKNFFGDDDEMYIAVFKAGNDLVLNFNKDPNEVYHMILVVAQAVRDDIIPEKQIDASVTKILEAKGLVVEN